MVGHRGFLFRAWAMWLAALGMLAVVFDGMVFVGDGEHSFRKGGVEGR